jgi:DNA-binding GntR family transcriptional regulator
MRTYDVSVTVARAAVNQLRTEGLVVTHQGKGSFVLSGARTPQASRDDELAGIRADLQALADRVAKLEEERR